MQKIHPLISLALQILHFQKFLTDTETEISPQVQNDLLQFMNNKNVEPTITSQTLLNILVKYDQYTHETLNGHHGKTAQFFQIYIRLVDYFLMFTTSIRTGDFEMYLYVLQRISNIFFMVNQPNYARYTVKYVDNLLKVDITHPGLKKRFEEGSFGVKRTPKNFSRQPVDLTLEQTINADAANKLTGKRYIINSCFN